MGCAGSKEKRASAYADFTNIKAAEDDAPAPTNMKNVAASKPGAAAAAASPIQQLPKPKLDPKDFRFVGFSGEIKIKQPGSINGQSFIIDKCENCDIYLLDWSSQVTIDECKKCRIFIGPTDGSVFIRDCHDCSFALVGRQLRTRGCEDCSLSVFCRTKPIVETSMNLRIACFDMSYPQLKDHMQAAKLGPFHNFWYEIFDFTPKGTAWD
ncbi:hypothetical protein GPECTOR_57g494 [Gonium pectorale]|uniref:C-CAP/cofactor C-like domain-containing protein n=1 Tax=Gonium pectorale TaxID=33097 RepID=A0A150G5V6_GONPE|nr:hypothetical protein GPECTOR_57g494 [Gonium pectorale]|eukprot:KXZ45204.1 hypothetical protein GPECTOR_57g494 [Gonium pectorale]